MEVNLTELCPINQELIVSTADLTGHPHIIFVLAKGNFENKLIFGLCETGKTYNNLLNNPVIAIAYKNSKGYFRISGKVELVKTGKIFDQLLAISKSPLPQLAVLVNITEIYDLDRGIKVL